MTLIIIWYMPTLSLKFCRRTTTRRRCVISKTKKFSIYITSIRLCISSRIHRCSNSDSLRSDAIDSPGQCVTTTSYHRTQLFPTIFCIRISPPTTSTTCRRSYIPTLSTLRVMYPRSISGIKARIT